LSQSPLHTELCDLLNIRYPIIQAGMAGGLGILGASRLTPDQLLQAILKIKSLTTRPFGVNLLLAPPEKSGNSDIVTVQLCLDKFRQELNIPTITTTTAKTPDITLPPSTISAHFEIIQRKGTYSQYWSWRSNQTSRASTLF
jgi:NAD(P)H-dependent flavin oxidoreductase YrpB (nitropropane dioxygenase family)